MSDQNLNSELRDQFLDYIQDSRTIADMKVSQARASLISIGIVQLIMRIVVSILFTSIEEDYGYSFLLAGFAVIGIYGAYRYSTPAIMIYTVYLGIESLSYLIAILDSFLDDPDWVLIVIALALMILHIAGMVYGSLLFHYISYMTGQQRAKFGLKKVKFEPLIELEHAHRAYANQNIMLSVQPMQQVQAQSNQNWPQQRPQLLQTHQIQAPPTAPYQNTPIYPHQANLPQYSLPIQQSRQGKFEGNRNFNPNSNFYPNMEALERRSPQNDLMAPPQASPPSNYMPQRFSQEPSRYQADFRQNPLKQTQIPQTPKSPNYIYYPSSDL